VHCRYRICEVHLKAPSLHLEGRTVRFCDQCARFHPVECFRGAKRTCIQKLEKLRKARIERRGGSVDSDDDEHPKRGRGRKRAATADSPIEACILVRAGRRGA
jgi:hypothetical protein